MFFLKLSCLFIVWWYWWYCSYYQVFVGSIGCYFLMFMTSTITCFLTLAFFAALIWHSYLLTMKYNIGHGILDKWQFDGVYTKIHSWPFLLIWRWFRNFFLTYVCKVYLVRLSLYSMVSISACSLHILYVASWWLRLGKKRRKEFMIFVVIF